MKTKKITIEDLARMVKRGFDDSDAKTQEGFTDLRKEMDGRFKEMNGRFTGLHKEMKDGFSRVNSRLDVVETRLANLDVVSRNEFDGLLGRVSYLERKLGIASGK